MVMEGLNKVLENYNKGKTALLHLRAANAGPHHRRNSSVRQKPLLRSVAQSEISLDGFSECPPPPVPVVLRGARERLTVELRDRKAPLAVMESLSDAESLYSLDSRRSSAAFRGSPMLGSLPFPLDAPIPEENPSLSSRTELLAADSLCQATPEHLGEVGPFFTPNRDSSLTPDYPMRLSPATPRYSGNHSPTLLSRPPPFKAESKTNSKMLPDGEFQQIPGVYSPGSTPPPMSPNVLSRAVDGEMGRWDMEAKPKTSRAASTPPSQLSNGNTSQAVLEFAQYLDSLFRLDGSSSPPLDLSDGESESGRGSYGQGECLGDGQSLDDKQLLARATLEPNLVPKPPRTFAGSADPSSGISLSPSFPLSSSEELNDLSPAEGVPSAMHPLRISSPCHCPEDNTLSSMV
ncbi:hypothetical protein WMY93_013511 [Mugilogobius chulae]|uniref:Uncharacterized protein n=1 Tax=Mugilogobius chulae TaxID=88201 RepID=A0AAW0P3U9_9GOBI